MALLGTLARPAIVAGVLLILLTSGAASGADSPSHASPSLSGGPAGAVNPSDRGSDQVRSTPARSTDGETPGAGVARSPVVEAVERQIADHTLNGRSAFLPTVYTHRAGPAPGGTVVPYPLSSPAPMGLSDIGIGPDGTSYEYNTSSFEGTIRLGSFASYSPGYAEFAEAPDWSTIQLNAVGVNISYPGSSTGTFWFQNVVHFNGTELQFEDNIWNFSSETSVMSPGTIFSHGAHGKVAEGTFYYDYGPSFPVSFPFTLTLSLQLVVASGHPAAVFNYSITNGSGPAGPRHLYDEVAFNGASTHPQFQVNGKAYDPFGNEYDAELILGGDGGGSNSNFRSLEGNATLSEFSAKDGRYVSVPSAYDHGVDSGETSTGVAATWQSTTEGLEQGPSFVYGLWNTTTSKAGASARPGYIKVSITVSPTFAFLFATGKNLSERSLAEANYSYAPTGPGGLAVTRLPPPAPGYPYIFNAWANGFVNASTPVLDNETIDLTLLASASMLVAPVYLDGDAQAAAYGAAKIPGTQYSAKGPTLWINASQTTPVAPFLRLNGFDYPTFVLFAAIDLNLTVHVNDFQQAPGSYLFTSSYDILPMPGPGWTQGYFFFYGKGEFSVGNTSLTGNSTLYYEGVASPAAVEFYGTTGSRAANVDASEESFGVAVIDSTAAAVRLVRSDQGANAVTFVDSTDSSANTTSTSGTDFTGYPSIGAYVDHSTDVHLGATTATAGSIGIYAQSSPGLSVWSVDATTPGVTETTIGVALNGSSDADVRDVRADTSRGVVANDSSDGSFYGLDGSLSPGLGVWLNSSDLKIDGLSAANTTVGLTFGNDSTVTVENATVSGGSTGILDFMDSNGGTFKDIRALSGSLGLNASFSKTLLLEDLTAENGSLGAALYDDSGVSAVGLSANLGSTGLLWNLGTNGSVEKLTVGNGSLGAEITNATHVTVRFANASAPHLVAPAEYYTVNPISFLFQPVAAVAFHTDSNVTVANVSAHFFPFAVWANDTNYSTIANVSAWSGYEAVALNTSKVVEIAAVFAFGNEIGVNVSHSLEVVVTGSTLEDSVSYGVVVDNATLVRVDANNFVGNNGADTKGTYSAAHIQAEAIDGSKVFFNSSAIGNYWSDHGATGAYVVRTSPTVIEDHHPEAAFISYWVEFIASGLPAATPWGFDALGSSYNGTQPLVYLPDWSLPDRAFSYTVLPTPGYVPRPAAGTVPAYVKDTNRTVTIDYSELYTVTFSESGLPLSSPWSVTLNGSTTRTTGATGSIVFHEIEGSYPYSIGPSPGWTESSLARSGTVAVTAADVTEKTIVWTRVLYAVTFTELGLSGKPSWSVTLNSTLDSSTGSTVLFHEPNGTFPYTVTPPPGYSTRTKSGSVTVSDGAAGVNVAFNSTATSPPAASFPWLYVGAGIGGLVVVLAVVAVVVSRRRRAPPEKPFSP